MTRVTNTLRLSAPKRGAFLALLAALVLGGCGDDADSETGSTGSGGSASASGGAASAVGGSAAGGLASGGVASGGLASGGLASGGLGSGGAGTGGLGTGGASPSGGGSSTGGDTTGTGGAGTGGLGSGGTGAGGVATGGSGTGGDGTGGVGTGGSGPRTTFRNPLNPDFGSDPWMTYYDGYYYLATTTWDQNVLTMKRGRTIQELKDATPQVIWEPGPTAASRAMWAPEFFLLDNGSGQMRWYFYFTAGDGSPDFVSQRSHVLESSGTDPMGPYTYKAQLLDYWAIDGSILEHGGNLYFMFSAWEGPTQNNYIQAMTNPWTLTGGRTRLTMPDYDWEKEGSAQVNEGAEPLYHEGRTFVTYSASQCGSPGYKLGLLELTGSDPMNANDWWKSPTPVFQAANGQYSTAHNGFFMSPDGTENWIVYHGVTNPNGSCWIDRTTRIQPFGWQDSGLPDFGEPLALDTDIYAPSGE